MEIHHYLIARLGCTINKYMHPYICGAFNKFPDFFVQAFKIVVDS